MDRITKKDALLLLKDADLLGLGMMADNFRKKLHPKGNVSFIIDRNINYTNVCINKCRFCAFYREADDPEAYVLSKRKLFNKIRETTAKKAAVHIHGTSPVCPCKPPNRYWMVCIWPGIVL